MIASIKYTDQEVHNIILLNVLKMLHRRKVIISYETFYNELKDTIKDNIFRIILPNKEEYNIYILIGKINNISQNTAIHSYLSKNIDIKKIILGKFDSNKPIKQIVNDFKNAEFFFEEEMMEDIPSKVFIPEHVLLDKEEKAELLSVYTKDSLPKILINDVMARYYNASVGDIFKIIRPSNDSGYSIYYRRVISVGNNNCLNF